MPNITAIMPKIRFLQDDSLKKLLSLTRNPLRLMKHFFFANAQEFAHTNVVVVTLPARSLGACLISVEVRVHDWPSRNNGVYLSTYLRAMFIGTSVMD